MRGRETKPSLDLTCHSSENYGLKKCFIISFVIYITCWLAAILTFGGFLIHDGKEVTSKSVQGTAHIK